MTPQTQFTPGPWTFNGESVLDSKGNCACTKTNGPLIASAPSLYAALQALVNGKVRISDKANDILSEHDPKVIEARRVLAMANGALDLGSSTSC